MSGKQMGKVWDHKFSRAEQAIMLALADHANHDGGDIYPSMGKIAWKTGYSRRHVIRIVGDLRERGILVVVEEADLAKHHATEYGIDWSKAEPKKPWQAKAHSSDPSDTMSPGAEAEASDTASPSDISADPSDTMAPPSDIAMSPPSDTAVSPQPSYNRPVQPQLQPPAEEPEAAAVPGEEVVVVDEEVVESPEVQPLIVEDVVSGEVVVSEEQVLSRWQEGFNAPAPVAALRRLGREHTTNWVWLAIREADLGKANDPLPYMDAALRSWAKDGEPAPRSEPKPEPKRPRCVSDELPAVPYDELPGVREALEELKRKHPDRQPALVPAGGNDE
jgi:hypothetical protein